MEFMYEVKLIHVLMLPTINIPTIGRVIKHPFGIRLRDGAIFLPITPIPHDRQKWRSIYIAVRINLSKNTACNLKTKGCTRVQPFVFVHCLLVYQLEIHLVAYILFKIIII